MEVKTFATQQEVLTAAQMALREILNDGVSPTLFLSSGGSALALLDMAAPDDCSWLTISVLDERVSAPEAGNFSALSKTRFFTEAHERGAVAIEPLARAESPETAAVHFEKALRAWRGENPAGRVVATLGIGVDGHTAGIMPYPENPDLFAKLFLDNSRWVAGYDAREKSEYPLRITATIPFLREEIDAAVVYATGKGKRSALTCVAANDGSLAETPARVIYGIKNVTIYTDLTI